MARSPLLVLRHTLPLLLAVLSACGPQASIGDPNPASLRFALAVNETAEDTVGFVNTGSASVEYRVTASSPWLGITSGASGSLGPGTRATVRVRVGCPASAGPLAGSLEILAVGAGSRMVPVALTCLAAEGTGDLVLDRFTIGQSVSAVDSAAAAALPLVADLSGLARAFVRAVAVGGPAPPVRLFYQLGARSGSIDLQGPAQLPTTPREGDLDQTFNALLPPDLLQPGLQVYLVVDPDDIVVEADETNNRYPPVGSLALDVRRVDALALTLLPVSYQGKTPLLDEATIASTLAAVLDMMPIADVRTALHAPVAFGGDLGSASGWQRLLGEIDALRAAEGSEDMYLALVDSPCSGVVGIGYVGWPVSVASSCPGIVASTVAHELGHNWNRRHAPCGEPSGVDPDYPYPDAATGVWGYSRAEQALKDPGHKDVMSYCGPEWISTYSYAGVLDYRRESGAASRQAAADRHRGPALLVRGSVRGTEVVLEPAFRLETVPGLPEAGPYVLVGLGEGGDERFRIPFGTRPIADLPGPGTEGFSFALPLDESAAKGLATLRVERGGEVLAEQWGGGLVTATRPTVRVSRRGGGILIDWQGRGWSLLVRNPDGAFLAFDDGGRLELVSEAEELELIFSDGVGSVARREVVP